MTPSTHRELAASLPALLRPFTSIRLPILGLAVGLAFGLSAGDAQAACTPDPPVDDDMVVCDGTDSTGYDGSGATGLTIITDGVTTLDDSDAALDSAILVSDENTVTIGLGATVTVTEDDGFGIRGGDDNDVTNDGVIVVDGANGVAVDVGNIVFLPDADPPVPEADVSVTNNGLITLNGANSVGLNSIDNYSLVNSASGTITINTSATGGVALQGVNDNVVENFGTIFIDADDGRAISIGDNTGLPLPNGAILRSSSRISINGNFGIAVEVGDNVGAITNGLIDLNGDDGIGLSVGDRTDPDAAANFTNDRTGTINVIGNRSYGMKVGDGWFSEADDGMGGTAPPAGDVRNFGTVNVTGSDSFGIFAGDETNLTGAHNSFVVNGGTISVMGADSVGVSLGGNDFLEPLDFEDPSANVFSFAFDNNGGTIEGGPDAGPLVEFRDFVPGFENRILNPVGSSILADLTNQGMPNRGIAIQGTDGAEFIFNEGTIQGDIRLEGGDDRYVINAGSTLMGTVFGGDGSDALVLGFGSGTVETFDLSLINGFEVVRVDGSDPSSGNSIGWALTNGASFTGETRVTDNGRLSVTSPTVLGGTLVIEPLGSVAVTIDPINTPLTVRQTATLDGTLVIDRPDDFETAGTYRLIQVDGGILNGTTFANEIFPSAMGIFSYSTLYDPNGVSVIFSRGTFAAAAEGGNRQAIGEHFDNIQADGTGSQDLLDLIADLEDTTGNLNDVYDALSPEAYDAQTTLVVDGGRRISKLLLNRQRECAPSEKDPWREAGQPLDCHSKSWSGWLAGVGGFQKRDGFAGHPDYDSHIGGAVFGVDSPSIGDFDFTFAISSQRGQVDVDNAGESDLVLADLSAYAAWNRGPLRLQSVLSWGWGRHNGRRAIQFDEGGTPVDVHGKDGYNSQHIAISGEAGFLIETGPVDIEPIVRMDWTWVDQDAIHEREAGSVGLNVDGRDDGFGSVTSGIRLSSAYHHQKYLHQDLEWMDGIWRPTLDLLWRQNVTGFDRDISARLVGSPDSVPTFSVEGKEDKGGLEIGAGLSFVPENANRLQFDVRYEAYRSSHTLDHNLLAKILIGF